jgi:protein O-mannosyl-transferase
MQVNRFFSKRWIQLCLFVFASFILFFPILNNSFLSDDFLVMRRIGIEKKILIKGFFRPLSDLSMYFNYLIGGFDPKGYYAFNILLHGINSFLLFIFCKKWKWIDDTRKQNLFAVIAAILFLTYPFHNESIAWIVGRGALWGNFFAFAALLFLKTKFPDPAKIFGACLCYFIGMAFYESLIFLPVIILILIQKDSEGGFKIKNWGIAFAVTFILHIILRIAISGTVLGEYGSTIIHEKIAVYLVNIFKVAGRLFLPPSDDTKSSSVIFILLLAAILLLLFMFYKQYKDNFRYKIFLKKFIMCLVVASIVPVMFAVSTRTSESDRFLYFPSSFLCLIVSFLILTIIHKRSLIGATVLSLLLYNIFFLGKNNANWKKASSAVDNIISTIKAQQTLGKIFIVNLPDESDGAFIFRQGFIDALLINKMDTSKIVLVNHLPREQERTLLPIIVPDASSDILKIAPEIIIEKNNVSSVAIIKKQEQLFSRFEASKDVILYWNKQSLVSLK